MSIDIVTKRKVPKIKIKMKKQSERRLKRLVGIPYLGLTLDDLHVSDKDNDRRF